MYGQGESLRRARDKIMLYRDLCFLEMDDQESEVKQYAFYGRTTMVEHEVRHLVDKMIEERIYLPVREKFIVGREENAKWIKKIL